MSLRFAVATEFSKFPRLRYRSEGQDSGEEFRVDYLTPRFKKAPEQGMRLKIDLDDAYGYATSFLEEAFGGLAREFGARRVLKVLEFKSGDEPYLIDDIVRYICRVT